MCENRDIIISIGIIALNEELYLPDLLDDIYNQNYEKKYIELIFVDSGSCDKTISIFTEFKNNFEHEYHSIKMLNNFKKKQSSGWNVVISNYTGDVLLRIDAHARIPFDFVQNNIKFLKKGEMVVGGLRSVKNSQDSNWNNTLLIAELSMFGSSIAGYRRKNEEKYVNSMFHAAYKREVITKTGYFNEFLGRTEDNEYHYRIRKNGYKLYYNSEIYSYQIIRSNLKKMINQKFSNGYWIGLTLSVCSNCLQIYHFIPFLFVVSILFSIFLFFNSISLPLFFLVGLYSIFVILNTLISFKDKKSNLTTIALLFIFPLLHISYGVGTLMGILKIPFWKDRHKARLYTLRGEKYE